MGTDVLRSRLEAAYGAYRQALRSHDPRALFAAVLLPPAEEERVRADFEGMTQWLLEVTPDLADATFIQAEPAGDDLAGYYFVWAYPQPRDVLFLFLKAFVRVKGQWRLAMTLAADPTMHLPLEPGEDVRAQAAALIASQPFLRVGWPEWLPRAEAAPAAGSGLVVHEADEVADRDVADALLVTGSAKGAKTPEGWTPLHAAAAAGRLDEVEALLAGGADPAAEDPQRVTPVHLAAERGHRAVVERLLACDAGLRTRDAERGYSALHCAVLSGDEAIIGLLLDRGADPDGNVIAGDTPLHLAARRGRLDLAQRLVDGGASLYSLDHDGSRPSDVVPDQPADDAERQRLDALRERLTPRSTRR